MSLSPRPGPLPPFFLENVSQGDVTANFLVPHSLSLSPLLLRLSLLHTSQPREDFDQSFLDREREGILLMRIRGRD